MRKGASNFRRQPAAPYAVVAITRERASTAAERCLKGHATWQPAKASLFSFLWFLSFCRKPRLGSVVLDYEQLSGRRCLFFQMRGTFPKPMVVSSLLAWCCQAAPTHVGGRGDKRLRRTAVASFLVRQPASARSAPYCFHGGGLDEVL